LVYRCVLRHLARKRIGPILQLPWPARCVNRYRSRGAVFLDCSVVISRRV